MFLFFCFIFCFCFWFVCLFLHSLTLPLSYPFIRKVLVWFICEVVFVVCEGKEQREEKRREGIKGYGGRCRFVVGGGSLSLPCLLFVFLFFFVSCLCRSLHLNPVTNMCNVSYSLMKQRVINMI